MFWKSRDERGLKDVENNNVRKCVSFEELRQRLIEEKEWDKKHPVIAKIKAFLWWVQYGIWIRIAEIPCRIKHFMQRGLRGYSDADVWDLGYYLANIISGALQQLKDNSWAEFMNSREFAKMVATFETAKRIWNSGLLYMPDGEHTEKDRREMRKLCKENKDNPYFGRVMGSAERRKYEDGWRLFQKHFFELLD